MNRKKAFIQESFHKNDKEITIHYLGFSLRSQQAERGETIRNDVHLPPPHPCTSGIFDWLISNGASNQNSLVIGILWVMIKWKTGTLWQLYEKTTLVKLAVWEDILIHVFSGG